MSKEPIFLLIETATEICSAALSNGTQIIGRKEDAMSNSHAKNLLPFIDEIMKQNNLTVKNLDAVVVSSGPGSYTGLRIGVSTAKGIAYTASIPLISVGTLTSVAAGCLENPQNDSIENPLIVPMIDARRMEVFTAVFDKKLDSIGDISSKVIEEDAFSDILNDNKVIFCGNGMPKCRQILSKSGNAYFDESAISAKNMLKPALKKWETGEFENTAYFEPFYLKEYIAGKPVVKGLI